MKNKIIKWMDGFTWLGLPRSIWVVIFLVIGIIIGLTYPIMYSVTWLLLMLYWAFYYERKINP